MKLLNHKKICIDCRFWGLEHTGLGRYTMKLVTELAKLDHQNQYYLLLKKRHLSTVNYQLKTKNFIPIPTDTRHYTLKEQITISKILQSIKPDIFHIPHFNIPIFYKLCSSKTKLIVTIHDLIKHSSVGSETTTLSKPVYWFKLAAHHLVFNQAIFQSSAIIVPSNFVKNQLIANFHIPETKIHVTYEAPDPIYYQETKKQASQKTINQLLKTYNLQSKSYLIYTGNVYPHKNLTNLIKAFCLLCHPGLDPGSPWYQNQHRRILKQVQNDKITLAIVCSRSV